MSTDPRQQPDWKQIQQIAKDLLNFPLNKPPDEPYDRNRIYRHLEQHKFGGVLRATAAEPPQAGEEGSASHLVGHSAVAYDKLYKALETLSKARKPSTNRKPKSPISSGNRRRWWKCWPGNQMN